MGANLIFIFIQVLLLLVLWLTGKRISRIEDMSMRSLFGAAWPGIVAFTLIEGLRFGRGLDYNLYASTFERSDIETWDILFSATAETLKSFDLGWQAFVILMSFALIVSVIFFIRLFPNAAPWGLPAFYFFLGVDLENFMRWGFAFSFVLIGFSYYLTNFTDTSGAIKGTRNILLFLLFSIIAFTVHFGIIIVPVAYLIISIARRPLMNPWVAIALFIGVGLFFQTSFMLTFSEYANLFMSLNSEKGEYYVANSAQWLTGGSDILTNTLRAFPPISRTLIYATCAWLGYKVCREMEYRPFTIVYNLFLIGFILLPVANQIEIFKRYNLLFFSMQFVVWGYIFYYYKLRETVFSSSLVRSFTLAVVLLFGVMTVMDWVKMPEYRCLYVWDANGQDYLDLNTTYYLDLYNKGLES